MKYILTTFLCIIYCELLNAQPSIKIESAQTLFVEMVKGQRTIGMATGFVIKSKTSYYLVTNYHVLTNKNPYNNSWVDSGNMISPDKIVVYHVDRKNQINHIPIEEFLYDSNGNHLWHQEKYNNQLIDVVELPLTNASRRKDIQLFPTDYANDSLNKPMFPPSSTLQLRPTDQIFIVGFPLGIFSNDHFPIWKSGTIASEPDFNQENQPIFYVDVDVYQGMSGSPVYFISNVITYKDGTQMNNVGKSSFFIGVFSAYESRKVFGYVWKGSYLKTIFDSLP